MHNLSISIVFLDSKKTKGLPNKVIDSWETRPQSKALLSLDMYARCTLLCLCSRLGLIPHRKRPLIMSKHVRGHLNLNIVGKCK